MTTLALLFALAGAPERSPVRDNPPFAEAVAAWKDKRWLEAADAFSRAYALDPRAEYVFARAQALRFAGDCERAVAAYREFIGLSPPRAAIDEARAHIETCGGETEEPAEPTPPPPPPRVEPEPTRSVSTPTEELPPRKWWRDPAGHVLAWTGLAAAGVGAGLLGEGLARRNRGEDAGDEQEYRDARRGGATLLHAGIPLLSIGGALVLASVIRFAVVGSQPKRPRRSTARLRLTAPIGVGIAWSP